MHSSPRKGGQFHPQRNQRCVETPVNGFIRCRGNIILAFSFEPRYRCWNNTRRKSLATNPRSFAGCCSVLHALAVPQTQLMCAPNALAPTDNELRMNRPKKKQKKSLAYVCIFEPFLLVFLCIHVTKICSFSEHVTLSILWRDESKSNRGIQHPARSGNLTAQWMV